MRPRLRDERRGVQVGWRHAFDRLQLLGVEGDSVDAEVATEAVCQRRRIEDGDLPADLRKLRRRHGLLFDELELAFQRAARLGARVEAQLNGEPAQAALVEAADHHRPGDTGDEGQERHHHRQRPPLTALRAAPVRVAEEAGFEPASPCGPVVFKTTAFSRSATPPDAF